MQPYTKHVRYVVATLQHLHPLPVHDVCDSSIYDGDSVFRDDVTQYFLWYYVYMGDSSSMIRVIAEHSSWSRYEGHLCYHDNESCRLKYRYIEIPDDITHSVTLQLQLCGLYSRIHIHILQRYTSPPPPPQKKELGSSASHEASSTAKTHKYDQRRYSFNHTPAL
jgi:hypothetical protein